jgi:hypothetical protein
MAAAPELLEDYIPNPSDVEDKLSGARNSWTDKLGLELRPRDAHLMVQPSEADPTDI